MGAAFRDWFLEQLAIYAAHHRDQRNQAIHHVCVPLIVFSVVLALTKVPLVTLGSMPLSVAPVALGTILIAYLIAVPAVGLVATALYAAVYLLVVATADLPSAQFWGVAVGCFAVGWIAQFIGHALEGRRPALMVNLIQVFIAPAFLIAEILFALRLQTSLAASVEERSVKYLAAAAE